MSRALLLSPLPIWFALILALHLAGVFEPRAGRPPLELIGAVVLPPAIFVVALLSWARFREAVLGTSLLFLTLTQSWRVIGVVFLVLYAFGMLPGVFAWPAGMGDVLVGLYAPFAAMMLVARRAGWRRHVLALNIFGLVDFAGALVTGLLSGGPPVEMVGGRVSSDIMQTLPLALIPTYFVPLWIMIHIASLVKLARE